jgi:hypothetical protein
VHIRESPEIDPVEAWLFAVRSGPSAAARPPEGQRDHGELNRPRFSGARDRSYKRTPPISLSSA